MGVRKQLSIIGKHFVQFVCLGALVLLSVLQGIKKEGPESIQISAYFPALPNRSSGKSKKSFLRKRNFGFSKVFIDVPISYNFLVNEVKQNFMKQRFL